MECPECFSVYSIKEGLDSNCPYCGSNQNKDVNTEEITIGGETHILYKEDADFLGITAAKEKHETKRGFEKAIDIFSSPK